MTWIGTPLAYIIPTACAVYGFRLGRQAVSRTPSTSIALMAGVVILATGVELLLNESQFFSSDLFLGICAIAGGFSLPALLPFGVAWAGSSNRFSKPAWQRGAVVLSVLSVVLYPPFAMCSYRLFIR